MLHRITTLDEPRFRSLPNCFVNDDWSVPEQIVRGMAETPQQREFQLKLKGKGRNMLRQHSAKILSTDSIPRVAFCIQVAVLLAGSATSLVFADEPANLPTIQVFKKVKENYASMTTYSDEGNVVITINDTKVIHFSTRLARTNFYLIEWQRVQESACLTSTKGQAVWSSGAGDFLQTDAGEQFQDSRNIALAHASAYVGGATMTVPKVFFNLQVENQSVDDLVFSMKRQANETVGDINCYVFTRGAMGATNTLWIGKEDFLIHQVQTVAQMKSMHAFTFTETHTNIVLNQKLLQTDFIPSFPLFESTAN
jgi:outer membrane lipoprotein-sorting protein